MQPSSCNPARSLRRSGLAAPPGSQERRHLRGLFRTDDQADLSPPAVSVREHADVVRRGGRLAASGTPRSRPIALDPVGKHPGRRPSPLRERSSRGLQFVQRPLGILAERLQPRKPTRAATDTASPTASRDFTIHARFSRAAAIGVGIRSANPGWSEVQADGRPGAVPGRPRSGYDAPARGCSSVG
jgi:hypothetical protein